MKFLMSIAIFAALSSSALAQSLEEEKQPLDTVSHLTIDEAWSLLATQYPGFAGYYAQGDQLVLQLSDDQARAAGTQVDSLLGTLSKSQSAKSVRTQSVRYGFDQLYKWHFQLIDLMGDTRFNVHSFDLDHAGSAEPYASRISCRCDTFAMAKRELSRASWVLRMGPSKRR